MRREAGTQAVDVEGSGRAGGRCGVPVVISRGSAARVEQDSPAVKLRHPLLRSLQLRRPRIAGSELCFLLCAGLMAGAAAGCVQG
jgi:hypothetical protein